jgi:hypothetical protein
MVDTNSYPNYFPAQKIPTSKKTKQWYIDCINAAENLALSLGYEEHRKMEVWYNLYNDVIDQEEMERVFNPLGLDSSAFPATIKNYPLSVPKIDLLQGEEIKRRFDWSVRAQNLDAYSSYQSDLSDMLMEILIEELQSQNYDEQKLQQRLSSFGKYAMYEWKDKNELTATRILQYLWQKELLQYKFNKNFLDALILGKEVARIDIEGEEPVFKRVDPRTFYSIRRGNSEFIEDSDIVLEITYEPIGKVIDAFYDYLTPSEIDAIENGHRFAKGNQSPLGYKNQLPPIYSNLDFGGGEGFINLTEFNNSDYKYGLPYDYEGNVRVVRVRWIGFRKIGILTYFDENGEEQTRLVPENYKPDKEAGEHVKWIWINEAYEGTKIGDGIFVKMQPREVQMRHFGNKSKCFLGYVGIDFGKSLMARMEPYQYLYNIYMYRLEMVLSKYKGPIYELDLSKVPDDWELDMWMYYADILGWAVVDPFNEGKKGAATGKLAGAFNTTGKVLDPNVGNYIQQIVMMLQYIEKMISDISGVNDQRLGQIENRETVGGVERAVTQSSHITEKWFFAHDEFKKKVMLALLDTAKYAWRKYKNKKLNYVLDDMSRQFIEFNGEDIATTEFDLFITNSSKDMEIRQVLKQLSQAAVQNGASMGIIIDVLRSDSITDMARRIERDERERQERLEQQEQASRESQERIAQLQEESKERDRELKKYEIDTNANTEIQKALISNGGINGDDSTIDREKLELARKQHEDSMKLEREKFSEDKRQARVEESIKRKELSIKKNSANKSNK